MSNNKTAVILCGGVGRRLRPLTFVFPKPMMPLGKSNILEELIKKLKNNGFKNIILSVGYKHELISGYFGNGKKFGVKINYFIEKTPLGTMGCLKRIKRLPKNFLVLNGDILTDLNFLKFFNQHTKLNKIFSIAAKKRKNQVDYGVLKVNNKKMLIDFKEKPIDQFLVSMGVYAVNKKIIDYIPNRNAIFGFDHLMKKLLNKNININVIEHNKKWLDIGRVEDYMKLLDNPNIKY